MNPRIKYFGAAILSTAIWGFFSIPLRKLKQYDSTDILIYRLFTSLIFTSLIILFFRRNILREDIKLIRSLEKKERQKNWLLMISSGIFITANWLAFIFVINRVNIQAGAFAYMVCPIITALLGRYLLGEYLSRIKWISIILCVISIAFLSVGFYTEVFYSVIIALLYAVYLIMQKKLIGVDKLNVLLVQLIISTLLIMPYHLSHLHAVPTDSAFWFNIVIISVFFTVIPLFLSLYALTGMPSSTMGIIIYMNPIVAFCVAFFYFGETATPQKMIAYGLLLFAVILFNRDFITGMLRRRTER